ncbi:universal stress protein [Flavobacteriaceae bacterium F89]|uniref:Universal stress protein n=1 Tax=Cerina litoralis TaxID=2874477 RepID=A0AAE3ET44_9FLAO|nr:universal stress protein [Cerina litoralis]MCG2459985.1 universal stress protein [Cerina litoralis]
MKKILYATDYSENSVPALRFSYALSKELDAELMVLHVFELQLTLETTFSHSYSREQIRTFANHREKLISFCSQHLQNEPQPLKITWKIDEGHPTPDTIIENAMELDADIIVVGSNSGNRERGNFLGSTTSELMNLAPCPVLAIPNDTDFHGFKKIVYATNFERFDIFSIQKMVNLAQTFKASIHLIQVTTKETDISEDQMNWFKNVLRHKVGYGDIQFDLRYGEDVFETLQMYISEIDPDLVAMLEHEDHNHVKSSPSQSS